MEGNQRSNIKSVVILYIAMILVFLFIYKGFIQSGEMYYKEYNEYLENNKNGGILLSNSLKRNKNSDSSIISNNNKHKIPQELSNIDNTLLESKSILELLNDKQERVIQQLFSFIHNYSNNSLTTLNTTLNELLFIKNEQLKIISYLDDISINVDSLRNASK